MSQHDEWIAHQRRRWLKPDWQRWLRHDAHRFAPPAVETKCFAARRIEQREVEEQAARAAAQDIFERDILTLRRDFANLRLEYELRRLQRKYNPDQPRVPAGNPDGGQWTDDGKGNSGSHVRLAAMSWETRRQFIFGQRDLLTEVGGGRGSGSATWLPAFRRPGAAAGVLRSPGSEDIELVSGTGGPASRMPPGTPGYDRLTRTHVEGNAAAEMRERKIMDATVYINNPEICPNCDRLLPKMLPPGARLKVIDGRGKTTTFIGDER